MSVYSPLMMLLSFALVKATVRGTSNFVRKELLQKEQVGVLALDLLVGILS